MRRLSRGLSPAALTLAGLCFALPFVTVGCDAPGGYGRATPGGTTTYSGADLLAGDTPRVSPNDHIRPPEARQDDRIGPRPGAIAALVLIGAGIVLTVVTADTLRRRRAATTVAATAAVVLAVEQALVESTVGTRLAEQLTVPMPAGHQPTDYVHTGTGFWLCLALLVATAALNTVGWLRTRSHSRPPKPEPALTG